MSSDEVYQKKYNIQPNPYKGAQASVLSRFGRQAQNLAGIAGSGAAANPTAKALTSDIASSSIMNLASERKKTDVIGRLRSIQHEMQSDSLLNRKSIAEAQLEQNEDAPWYETAASGISVYNAAGQLARGVQFSLGGDENVQYDEDIYNKNYEEMKWAAADEAGIGPDDLSYEQLKDIHKEALVSARTKNRRSNIGKGVGAAFGGVAAALEWAPILGQPLKDLRRANMKKASEEKTAQDNTATPDMIKKQHNALESSLNSLKDLYGEPFQISAKYETALYEFLRLSFGVLGVGDIPLDFTETGTEEETETITELTDPEDDENEPLLGSDDDLPEVLRDSIQEY